MRINKYVLYQQKDFPCKYKKNFCECMESIQDTSIKKNFFANIKKDFYKYMDRSGTLLQKKFLCNYNQFFFPTIKISHNYKKKITKINKLKYSKGFFIRNYSRESLSKSLSESLSKSLSESLESLSESDSESSSALINLDICMFFILYLNSSK